MIIKQYKYIDSLETPWPDMTETESGSDTEIRRTLHRSAV